MSTHRLSNKIQALQIRLDLCERKLYRVLGIIKELPCQCSGAKLSVGARVSYRVACTRCALLSELEESEPDQNQVPFPL